MRALCGTILSCLLCVLAGCGAAPSWTAQPPSVTPAPSTPDTSNTGSTTTPHYTLTLNENWHFQSTTDPRFFIDTTLGRGPGKLEGAAYIGDSSSCFWMTTADGKGTWYALIQLTGTIDDQGHVSIRSESIHGSVLSVTGTLVPDGTALVDGTYEIIGCGNTKTGDVTGKQYKPLTGTFRGTLNLDGKDLATTVDVTQAPVAYPAPFALTGTVTISGETCSETWHLSSTYSSILGSRFDIRPIDGPEVQLLGFADPDATSLKVLSYYYLDDCSAGATGTLQRQ